MKKNVVYYGSKELINVSEVKYPKDAIISALNEDGTRGVAVNVVVTPTNIDPADLKFNLVNSEGATIFEEAVVSTLRVLCRELLWTVFILCTLLLKKV